MGVKKRVHEPWERYYPIYAFKINEDRWDAICPLPEFKNYRVSETTGLKACILMTDVLISSCNWYLSRNKPVPRGVPEPKYLKASPENEYLCWFALSIDANKQITYPPNIYQFSSDKSYYLIFPQENLWTQEGISKYAEMLSTFGLEIKNYGNRLPSPLPGLNPYSLPVLRTLKYDVVNDIMCELIAQSHHGDLMGKTINDPKIIYSFINNCANGILCWIRQEIHKYSLEELLLWFFPQIEVTAYLVHHQTEGRFTRIPISRAGANIEKIYSGIKKPIRSGITLSQKQVIEIAIAESPNGTKKLTNQGYDLLLGLGYCFYNFWFIKSRLSSPYAPTEITVYPYGIGERVMNGNWDEFLFLKEKEAKEIDFGEYLKYNSDNQYSKKRESLEGSPKENAFFAEFGLTFTQLEAFQNGLLNFCSDNRKCFYKFSEKAFRNYMIESFGWSENLCSAGLDLFCISPRGKWDDIPEGYVWNDIDPGNQFGSLSFRRRPLIRIPLPNGDSWIYYGERNFAIVYEYILERIDIDKYPCKSDALRKWIRRCRNADSAAFVSNVTTFIKKELALDVINGLKPHKIGLSLDDIGDIDLAVLDYTNNIFYSIECKNVTHARNIRQSENEVENFGVFRREGRKNEFLEKHLRRDNCLKEHTDKIQDLYNFSMKPEIVSLFLTSHIIESQVYSEKLIIPIISYHELLSDGKAALERCRTCSKGHEVVDEDDQNVVF